jgi:hypothetical protein
MRSSLQLIHRQQEAGPRSSGSGLLLWAHSTHPSHLLLILVGLAVGMQVAACSGFLPPESGGDTPTPAPTTTYRVKVITGRGLGHH